VRHKIPSHSWDFKLIIWLLLVVQVVVKLEQVAVEREVCAQQ
jgi:hypothetical protein